MSRDRDEAPAVRVYTVCDESKYLIVRNVPALGCGDELSKLFEFYGEIEECKPKDDEDCEPFTDVYWIKFYQVNSGSDFSMFEALILAGYGFAKRKLDKFVFLGNQLQVSYAPEYESLSDTKEKLEGRRMEVVARLYHGRSRGSVTHKPGDLSESSSVASPPQTHSISPMINSSRRYTGESSSMTRVTSDKDYFPSQSMNQTVQLVQEKLNKIQSHVDHVEAGPSKKIRVDNRRRI